VARKKKMTPVTAAPRKALPTIPTSIRGLKPDAVVSPPPVVMTEPGGSPAAIEAPEPVVAAAAVTAVRQYQPGATTLAGAAFIPAGTSRADRRRVEQAARAVEADARRAEMDVKRAEVDAEKAERRAAQYLPRAGEIGPDSLRMYRPLKVQSHRATSEVLGGAYPFLAEAGLGSDGIYIGTDSYSAAGFVYDPWVLYQKGVLTNPNILLAGIIGRGKSAIAKCLATRSIAFGRKVYVPGDAKGEWSVVAKAVGGQVIALGGGLDTRLNPLDEGPRPRFAVTEDGGREPMTDRTWHGLVTDRRRNLLRSITESALGRAMQPTESTALFAALDTAVHDNDDPILPHVVAAMFEPSDGTLGSTRRQLIDDGRDVAHALNRLVNGDLAGLFDGPSTARFNPDLPMVSLDLSRIGINSPLIALVMTCASTWMEAALIDPDDGQRWVVYDEAWKLLADPSLLARMQSQWKLSRHLGIANLMVIHRLSDLAAVGDSDSQSRNLAEGLLADCSTKIIYAQEAGEAEKTGRKIGLTAAEIAQLPNLERGEGLWKIKDRAFMVRNRLTPGELVLFDTNSRMGRHAEF
jgi:hypothetical protein